jgi:preprotein translocase subunit SecA
LLGNEETIKKYIEEVKTFADEKELVEINEKLKNEDKGFWETLRRVILQATDMFWVEHLEVMDYMRSSVNLRAYGQRDPLVEYKKEGLRLFKEMETSIALEILKLIPQIKPEEVFYNAPVKLNEVREDAGDLTSVLWHFLRDLELT